MSQEINTNIAAMDAANNLSPTERSMPQSDRASRNAQDGVSFVQTADGALGEVRQMLQRIRELAVQYANGTVNGSDQTAIQTAIQSEVSQLISGIERIGSTAQFNDINLLKSAATISFQVGANDGDVISTATVELLSPILGGGHGQQGGLPWELVGPHGEVVQGVGMYDHPTNPVGRDPDSNGGFFIDTLATYGENLSCATSQITVVDMATALTAFTSQQVLQQAGVSMLIQAQKQPQAVLPLLE